MKNLIRSSLSMGWLGLIFVLMALAVLAGSFAVLDNQNYFSLTWERIDALTLLEDRVRIYLHEMQLHEYYCAYALDFRPVSDDEWDAVTRYADEVDLLLDDLVYMGHFSAELSYYPEDVELFNDFRALLDQHRESFEGARQIDASGDANAAIDEILWIQGENADLQAMLDELIARVDADRLELSQLFPTATATGLLGVSGALVAMLLLALAGYRAVAGLTQPVVDLTNTVIAIGGDRYRPELLGGLLKQGGPAGHFARALDAFARSIEERDATLKTEIEKLREQLYESRRRRLKISDPSR